MKVLRLGIVSSLVVCNAFNPVSKPLGSKFDSSSVNLPKTALNLGVQEAWTAYNDALEADPLVVKSVTASVILGAADLAGQAIESKQKGDSSATVDMARTLRFAFFGLVLQAPWNHFYYLLLDGALPPTEEPWTATTGIKVVIDQFVQAPIFTVLIFAFLGFLEGKNLEAVKKQLDDDYTDTMLANCKSIAVSPSWIPLTLTQRVLFDRSTLSVSGKLWVPATAINIAFVPPILRVLYLNCVFFFWSIFLSLKLNKEETES